MNSAFLIEGVLIGGSVLAFAVWELWSLEREKRKDRARQPPASPPSGS